MFLPPLLPLTARTQSCAAWGVAATILEADYWAAGTTVACPQIVLSSCFSFFFSDATDHRIKIGGYSAVVVANSIVNALADRTSYVVEFFAPLFVLYVLLAARCCC